MKRTKRESQGSYTITFHKANKTFFSFFFFGGGVGGNNPYLFSSWLILAIFSALTSSMVFEYRPDLITTSDIEVPSSILALPSWARCECEDAPASSLSSSASSSSSSLSPSSSSSNSRPAAEPFSFCDSSLAYITERGFTESLFIWHQRLHLAFPWGASIHFFFFLSCTTAQNVRKSMDQSKYSQFLWNVLRNLIGCYHLFFFIVVLARYNFCTTYIYTTTIVLVQVRKLNFPNSSALLSR